MHFARILCMTQNFNNYQNDLLKQTKRKNKVKLILMMLRY